MAEEMKNLEELKRTKEAMMANDSSSQDIEIPNAPDDNRFADFGEGFSKDEVVDDGEVGIIINNAAKEKENAVQAPSEEIGRGVIVDKKVIPDRVVSQKGVAVGALANKERQDDVEVKMLEVDNMIDEQRKLAQERIKAGIKPKKEINDPYATKEIQDANAELHNTQKESQPAQEEKDDNSEQVTILIDKTGLGTVEFTDDEKRRIEYSKRINLIEVENKNLQTLKVKKKISNKHGFKLMERNYNKGLSPVIALASGYTCRMKNIYASEAMRMIQQPGEETANSLLDKWSEIYKRIVDVSRGPFKDFEDFAKHTAFVDYDHFLYAMICSSYPDQDELPFKCNSEHGGCDKDFVVKYTNRDMIRADLITPEVRVNIQNIINNAAFVDKAKELADTYPVNITKRFVLNDLGTVVELYMPSVYETIENVFKKIDKDHSIIEDQSNRNNLLIAQAIKTIYDVDYDESTDDDIYYIEISGLEAILERLNKMTTRELRIIAEEMEKLSRPYSIRYGFKKVVCAHCHKDWGEYDISLDDILFQRVRQSANVEITSNNTGN